MNFHKLLIHCVPIPLRIINNLKMQARVMKTNPFLFFYFVLYSNIHCIPGYSIPEKSSELGEDMIEESFAVVIDVAPAETIQGAISSASKEKVAAVIYSAPAENVQEVVASAPQQLLEKLISAAPKHLQDALAESSEDAPLSEVIAAADAEDIASIIAEAPTQVVADIGSESDPQAFAAAVKESDPIAVAAALNNAASAEIYDLVESVPIEVKDQLMDAVEKVADGGRGFKKPRRFHQGNRKSRRQGRRLSSVGDSAGTIGGNSASIVCKMIGWLLSGTCGGGKAKNTISIKRAPEESTIAK